MTGRPIYEQHCWVCGKPQGYDWVPFGPERHLNCRGCGNTIVKKVGDVRTSIEANYDAQLEAEEWMRLSPEEQEARQIAAVTPKNWGKPPSSQFASVVVISAAIFGVLALIYWSLS